MKAPNILFFFPDQHRFDWTSLNNDLPLETHNYERLCREGTFFKNAICPSPLCSPSRACMAAGKRYGKTGVRDNGQDFSLTAPNFYRILRDAGYHTMGCGKFDLLKPSHNHGADGQHRVDGRNLLKELGFTDGIDSGGKWDGVGTWHRGDSEPYMEYLKSRDLAEVHIADMEKRRGANMFKGTFPTPLPDDAYVDNWIAETGLMLLDRAPQDQPWFLQVNFNGPHDPMDITENMEMAVRNKKFPQPTNNEDEDWSPADHLATRQNYAAMIENIDERIGDFLDYLEDTGQLENTLVVYSSDHGEMLGDFGHWAKRQPYQPSVGVPLAVMGPGVETNRRIEAPTEILDLVGTFLDYSGAGIPEEMDCRSLRPVLEGDTDRVRDVAISGLGQWRVAMKDQWKLVLGHEPEEPIETSKDNPRSKPVALFNLFADPWENRNVTSEYPDITAELTAAIFE